MVERMTQDAAAQAERLRQVQAKYVRASVIIAVVSSTVLPLWVPKIVSRTTNECGTAQSPCVCVCVRVCQSGADLRRWLLLMPRTCVQILATNNRHRREVDHHKQALSDRARVERSLRGHIEQLRAQLEEDHHRSQLAQVKCTRRWCLCALSPVASSQRQNAQAGCLCTGCCCTCLRGLAGQPLINQRFRRSFDVLFCECVVPTCFDRVSDGQAL